MRWLVDCTQSISSVLVIGRLERARCTTARETGGPSPHSPRNCAPRLLQSLDDWREKKGTACSLGGWCLSPGGGLAVELRLPRPRNNNFKQIPPVLADDVDHTFVSENGSKPRFSLRGRKVRPGSRQCDEKLTARLPTLDANYLPLKRTCLVSRLDLPALKLVTHSFLGGFYPSSEFYHPYPPPSPPPPPPVDIILPMDVSQWISWISPSDFIPLKCIKKTLTPSLMLLLSVPIPNIAKRCACLSSNMGEPISKMAISAKLCQATESGAGPENWAKFLNAFNCYGVHLLLWNNIMNHSELWSRKHNSHKVEAAVCDEEELLPGRH